jgi:membrane-bound lytic murein transglycosylase A
MAPSRGFARLTAGLAALLAVAALAGCMTRAPTPPQPPQTTVQPIPQIQLTAMDFRDLEGWKDSDPVAALGAFLRSCSVLMNGAQDRPLGGIGYAGLTRNWREACDDAGQTAADAQHARAFFESEFLPYRVTQGASLGLFTGYYEPELRGSRTRKGPYQTPLYGVPPDLVSVDLGLFRDAFKGQRLTGRVVKGRLVPYPARADIVARGIAGATPLFYIDHPADAFFLQVQGSGRVRLDDGSIVRTAFAGQNGQPYTAIGAVLVERGQLAREEVSLQSIRAWMAAHPQDAQELMNANASYVFFTEKPIGDPALGADGTQGVPLTPEASLAVDTGIHALGVPVWLETSAPDADASLPARVFDRLLVMQDTGGAIRGAVRGDVYWGYGARPGAIAGRMRSEGRMTVLLPKAAAAKLGASASYAGPR